jgi:hypothetical protein
LRKLIKLQYPVYVTPKRGKSRKIIKLQYPVYVTPKRGKIITGIPKGWQTLHTNVEPVHI